MNTDRRSVPSPLDPIPFNTPPIFRETLANGLKIVLVPDRRFPLVSLRLAFMTGDANDPKDSIGITSALASLVTEGTTEHSSRELAEKIERLGASLNASSNDDFIIVAASSLSMYFEEILQLMSEVVFVPTFPDNEVDLYKRNTIENLKFNRSQPGFLASEQVGRCIYGQHPYAVIAPRPSDIERIDREALEELRRNRFVPNNAVLFAVGDLQSDDFLMIVERLFGDWESGDRHIHEFPNVPDRKERSLVIVDRPGSAQSNIVLANSAIKRDDPDFFPLLVMNQVLGAGASSRVFMNLREEKGYTYGAYTRLDAKRWAGSFEATAEVRTAVTGASLKEFFYEFDRIRNEDALEEEVNDAKNFLAGVFPIRAETQEGLTNLIVNQELYGLPHDYLETYRDNVRAVSVEDVRRVANKYIRPDDMVLVVVGDASEILGQARDFADSIEIFDKDGVPKEMSEYETSESADAANVAGDWKLSLNFMGSDVEIKMSLEQDGSSVSGTLTTMLGEGKIEGGRVNGNKVSATAATEIQGQSVEFNINGTVNGDSINGSIESPMIPNALEFTGTRA